MKTFVRVGGARAASVDDFSTIFALYGSCMAVSKSLIIVSITDDTVATTEAGGDAARRRSGESVIEDGAAD